MINMSFISQLYCQIKKNDLQHCSVQIIFFAILCNERSLSAIDIVFKADKVILNSIGGAVMIEKIAIDLVGQMTEAKLIHEDMAERYIYVSISWMEKLISIGTILLISVVNQQFLPTVFFLAFFLELRKRTGGYHFNKFYQCYLGTTISYLLILFIGVKVVDYPQQLFAVLLFAIGIIGIIGTVNHPNMHMNSEEMAESKKEARITVLLEASIICGCVLFGADMIFISYMAIAVILCAALLCIAKILKQEVKENEESQ